MGYYGIPARDENLRSGYQPDPRLQVVYHRFPAERACCFFVSWCLDTFIPHNSLLYHVISHYIPQKQLTNSHLEHARIQFKAIYTIKLLFPIDWPSSQIRILMPWNNEFKTWTLGSCGFGLPWLDESKHRLPIILDYIYLVGGLEHVFFPYIWE